MRRFWKLALLAAITLVPVATLKADDAADTEISRQIVEQLNSKKSEGSLKGFNIGLSVENGVVWLEGHVSDKSQHDMAIDIARRVSGVEQVVDGVSVNQPNAPAVQGVLVSAAETVTPEGQPRELRAQPIYADMPRTASAAPLAPQMLRPIPAASQQQTPSVASMPTYQQGSQDQAQSPAQMPRAFAPAGTQDFRYASARMQPPVPVQPPSYYPTASGYASPVRYDNPQMPGYAWPAYAAYPNYAALQYPKKYSPAAWPYVGPFYPYPQVPLGWRKVTMEFNKGWWTVDFQARRHGRW